MCGRRPAPPASARALRERLDLGLSVLDHDAELHAFALVRALDLPHLLLERLTNGVERDVVRALPSLADLAHWQDNACLAAETRLVEAELAGQGRVLIRASGTEPVLRVMVESRDAAQGRALAERLATAAKA